MYTVSKKKKRPQFFLRNLNKKIQFSSVEFSTV